MSDKAKPLYPRLTEEESIGWDNDPYATEVDTSKAERANFQMAKDKGETPEQFAPHDPPLRERYRKFLGSK